MLACQLCGRPVGRRFGCSRCNALFYCSDKHRRLHAEQCHQEECSRMKQQMDKGKGLEIRWFPWWAAACSIVPAEGAPPAAQHPLCTLLQAEGCHGQGIWRAVCPCEPFEQQQLAVVWPGSMEGVQKTAQERQRPSKRARAEPEGCTACDQAPVAADGEAVSSAGKVVTGGQGLGTALHTEGQPTRSAPGTEGRDMSTAPDAQGHGKSSALGSAQQAPSIGSWRQLYHHLGLHRSSPAALSLHFAMTTALALLTVDHLGHGQLLRGGSSSSSSSSSGSGFERADTCAHPQQDSLQRSSDGGGGGDGGGDCGGDAAAVDQDAVDSCGQKGSGSVDPGVARGGGSIHTDPQQDQVHVLYVGPRSELAMLPSFGLLLELLPRRVQLSLHFVGPDVPSEWHGRVGRLPADAAAHLLADMRAGTQQAHSLQQQADASQACPAPAAEDNSSAGSEDGWSEWLDQLDAVGLRPRSQRPDKDDCDSDSCSEQGGLEVEAGHKQFPKAPASSGAPSPSARRNEEDAAGNCERPGRDSEHGNGSEHMVATAEAFQRRCLQLSFWQGHLHQVADELASRYAITTSNAVAVMPNAGLAAYPSWVPTMQALLPCAAAQQNPRTETGCKPLLGMPCIVTDYCEEALHKAKAMLQELCGLQPAAHPILMNPFRQPWHQGVQGNVLPSFSNGFMLILNAPHIC